MNKLSRVVVRRSASAVYIAQRDVRLQVWVAKYAPDGEQENTSILLSDNGDSKDQSNWTPLGIDMSIFIHLTAGEALYAKVFAYTDSYLSMSAEYK